MDQRDRSAAVLDSGRRRIGTTTKRATATNRLHDIGPEEEDLEAYRAAGVGNEYDDRKKTCNLASAY
jgi:hypothetical protein